MEGERRDGDGGREKGGSNWEEKRNVRRERGALRMKGREGRHREGEVGNEKERKRKDRRGSARGEE